MLTLTFFFDDGELISCLVLPLRTIFLNFLPCALVLYWVDGHILLLWACHSRRCSRSHVISMAMSDLLRLRIVSILLLWLHLLLLLFLCLEGFPNESLLMLPLSFCPCSGVCGSFGLSLSFALLKFEPLVLDFKHTLYKNMFKRDYKYTYAIEDENV